MKLTRESLFTYLNLHFAAIALLALANLVLLTRLVLAWHTLSADRPEQIAQYQTSLKTLELQTKPLAGLPAKVQVSNTEARRFYDRRMPANYSSISAELFTLADKSAIRLTRIAYTPVPIAADLVELRMDASLTGSYAPMMHFINGLERDRMFFVINNLTFTGQQGGAVGVRLRVTTYLHAADATSQKPPADVGSDEANPASASTGAAGAPAGGE